MSDNLSPGCRDMNVDETIAHLGGRGLRGALVYAGTHRIEHGSTEVRLYVNGKPGWRYIVSVTVSAADLYDVTLWGLRGATKRALGSRNDVFFDELQRAVEQLYDDVMERTNGGQIPLR
jgi:hypothetical protein